MFEGCCFWLFFGKMSEYGKRKREEEEGDERSVEDEQPSKKQKMGVQ